MSAGLAVKHYEARVIELWDDGVVDTTVIRDVLMEEIEEEDDQTKDELIRALLVHFIPGTLAQLRHERQSQRANSRQALVRVEGTEMSEPDAETGLRGTIGGKKEARQRSRLMMPYAGANNRLKPLGEFTVADLNAMMNRYAKKAKDAEVMVNKFDTIRSRMYSEQVEQIKDLHNIESLLRRLDL